MRSSSNHKQKRLPLEIVELPETAMRAAFDRCRLGISFERAMADRGIRICLRNLAVSSMRKGKGK